MWRLPNEDLPDHKCRWLGCRCWSRQSNAKIAIL